MKRRSSHRRLSILPHLSPTRHKHTDTLTSAKAVSTASKRVSRQTSSILILFFKPLPGKTCSFAHTGERAKSILYLCSSVYTLARAPRAPCVIWGSPAPTQLRCHLQDSCPKPRPAPKCTPRHYHNYTGCPRAGQGLPILSSSFSLTPTFPDDPACGRGSSSHPFLDAKVKEERIRGFSKEQDLKRQEIWVPIPALPELAV